jgi:acyl-CoA thioesterase
LAVDLEALRTNFDGSAYARHLGMKIVDLSSGYARVQLEIRPEFLTWDNLVQGGVITSLLDQAFGCAINTFENVNVAVHLDVDFLGACGVGDTICAESRVIRAGRTIGVCEMSVVDSKGKLIARGSGITVSRGTRR